MDLHLEKFASSIYCHLLKQTNGEFKDNLKQIKDKQIKYHN